MNTQIVTPNRAASILESRPENRETLVRLSLVVLIVGAFGPYIAPGLRTEQVAAYSLSAMLLVFYGRYWKSNQYIRSILFLQSILLVGAVTVSILVPMQLVLLEQRGVFSGIDTLVMPIALIIVTYMCINLSSPLFVLKFVCKILLLFLAMNTIAQWLQINEIVDLTTFWAGDQGEIARFDTVAGRAAANERFGGVFNQPGEAGIAYAVGLLTVLVPMRRSWPYKLSFALVVVGGVLTASKIFLVGCAILIVVLLFRQNNKNRVIILLAVLVSFGVTFYFQGEYLRRILDEIFGNEDLIFALTAGRIGIESGNATLEYVTQNSPIFGFGVAGLNVSYDSQIIEYLVLFGAVGFIIFLMMLATIWVAALRTHSDYRAFSVSMAALVSFAALGMVVFTGNRSATVVWLILTVILSMSQPNSKLAGFNSPNSSRVSGV